MKPAPFFSRRLWRIGTRKSPLALAQTAEASTALRKKFPGIRLKITPLSTFGDEFQSVELFKRSQQGIFTKAIEKKLKFRIIDLAVHSLKDLPTQSPKGLRLAAVLERADTADALISKKNYDLKSLPKHAVVGTGSLRRKCQLLKLRPDLRVEPLRGNLGTRIRKTLHEKKYDAILVAQAGILRLGGYASFAKRIAPHILLPAVGQGAIAIQARSDDAEALRLAKAIHHPKTAIQTRAERAFLETLHGGCRVPLGVHTRIRNKKIRMTGAVFSVRSDASLKAYATGPDTNAEAVGRKLAQKLLRQGARKLLKEAREL